ncbi:hypothetical protein [Bartonella bovis]|uniref:hypothetical protein n=1 Tax=Bartonella bovis TaxID=155194 RepID=UPI000C9C2E3A|nr:hypothetical protein [Bartonella bovis]
MQKLGQLDMFKKIRTVVIYSVGFAVLQFLQIEKNTEFIQAVLIFSLLAILVTMVFMTAFFNSRLASELYHNPKHQYEKTTDLNIVTDYLQKYLYNFLHMVVMVLLLLIFQNVNRELELIFWHIFLLFVGTICLQMYGFVNNFIKSLRLNAVHFL